MAILKLNNTTEITETSGVASIASTVKFPAGTVINYKFVEIGSYELTGTYTTFNVTSAATTAQGMQVITTSFSPNSNNSKIFCQAQMFVNEATNLNDWAMSALFVDTINVSQQNTNARHDSPTYLDYSVATLSGEYTNNSTTAKTIEIRVSGYNDRPIDVNLYSRSNVRQTDGYIKTGLSIFEVQQ
jgi:hypothetical protein